MPTLCRDWNMRLLFGMRKAGYTLYRTILRPCLLVVSMTLISGVTLAAIAPLPTPKVTVTLNDTIYGKVVKGTTVHASWTVTGFEVVDYQAAVSARASESGILPGTVWQSFGTSTEGDLTNLPVADNKLYYVLVRAYLADGRWSKVGASRAFKIMKEAGSVVITPENPSIVAQKTRKFTATVYAADFELLKGRKIVWECASEAGSINPAGVFKAACAAGTYPNSVTATVYDETATSTTGVTIIPGAPAKVVVSPNNATVAAGLTQQFTAVVTDNCGNPVPGATVKWAVTNRQAGTIDQNGVLTAGTKLATFKNVVKATSVPGGKVGVATVTVVQSLATAEAGVPPDIETPDPGVRVTFNENVLGAGKDVVQYKLWRDAEVVDGIGPMSGLSKLFDAGQPSGSYVRPNPENPSQLETYAINAPPLVPGESHNYYVSVVYQVTQAGTGEKTYYETDPAAAGQATLLSVIPVSDMEATIGGWNIGIKSVDFAWLSVPGADQYIVEATLATDPTFRNPKYVSAIKSIGSLVGGELVTITGQNLANKFPGITDEDEILWRVGARNSGDRPGPIPSPNGRFIYSETASIYYIPSPPPPPF